MWSTFCILTLLNISSQHLSHNLYRWLVLLRCFVTPNTCTDEIQRGCIGVTVCLVDPTRRNPCHKVFGRNVILQFLTDLPWNVISIKCARCNNYILCSFIHSLHSYVPLIMQCCWWVLIVCERSNLQWKLIVCRLVNVISPEFQYK